VDTSVLVDAIAGEKRGAEDTVQVLAAFDGDTVFLSVDRGDTKLLWTRGSGSRRAAWQSLSFDGLIPHVALVNLDGSSRPALFYTVHYENFVFGKVFVGPANARQIFMSSDEACRVPKLQDVNGDGRLEVLDYVAGALSVDECTEHDVLARPCMDHYPTEWVEVWSLDNEGGFSRDSLGAVAFYRELAEKYRLGAAELAAALDRRADAVPSPRCDTSMVVSLQRMAERAALIGTLRN